MVGACPRRQRGKHCFLSLLKRKDSFHVDIKIYLEICGFCILNPYWEVDFCLRETWIALEWIMVVSSCQLRVFGQFVACRRYVKSEGII